MKFNENLFKLETENSFYAASLKVSKYKEEHPNNKVISLGIGDVSFPINSYVASKMKEAIDNETSSTFVGYGNYYGLKELREAIKENEYNDFSIDEIYVGNGTKSDVGDILEMFSPDCVIGIVNPSYPIYENSLISLNRKYEFIESDEDLKPKVPANHYDLIYLCSPNNPTGFNFSKEEIKPWIEYALRENAVILYDNVYFKFIRSGIKSIYEVEGAKKCAIEFRSFSKHASFTGIRCSYYVVPKELNKDINKFWKYRTINRFNGASYISQVGALASFDKSCIEEIDKNISYYLDNAQYLINEFKALGYKVMGGINAPYIFIECKNGLNSWETFNLFLEKYEVIVVPGIIFGSKGNNYFRVSSLGRKETIVEAINRIKKYEHE